ncbi:uncharacterized protein ACA1_299930 [Acanthamoeba castellanii str. Neff]|uniref:Uncharacterized protein n=1 Tax=Acanthamoeba castellanii (strain ATCC 30010 / Neff) TaxID=1257118 RepID=L8HE92_ACACF|nr:uncharacterized protein ACA1_299930 [Acanthamoeba castellanii str. Neff]ELR22706.1 hypothetical protein ACA1_299930 [Acanthamoeba castellanii str. Neff]
MHRAGGNDAAFNAMITQGNSTQGYEPYLAHRFSPDPSSLKSPGQLVVQLEGVMVVKNNRGVWKNV